MASIWIAEPGKAPRKLEGNLPLHAVTALFKNKVAKVARANNAEVTYQDDMTAMLRFPPVTDGKLSDVLVEGPRFTMFVEPCSPPSAPEPGQPKVLAGQGKGILVTTKGAVDLPLPVKP
jgi:hypothetical protein